MALQYIEKIETVEIKRATRLEGQSSVCYDGKTLIAFNSDQAVITCPAKFSLALGTKQECEAEIASLQLAPRT